MKYHDMNYHDMQYPDMQKPKPHQLAWSVRRLGQTAVLMLFLTACSSLSGLNIPGLPTSSATTPEQVNPNFPALPPNFTPQATPIQPQVPTQPFVATVVAEPTRNVPTVAPATTQAAEPVGPTLAFMKEGDVWLLDQPGTKPYPLTVMGNLISYVWAPNGERMAVFDGHSLCMVNRDGSVRTACLDLGLNDTQSKIARKMVWSPDQRYIVLWNSVNPWDAGAIGWMVIALDGSNLTYRIEDPVDWGASLSPNNDAGGFTGQPVFLSDGRLVGTLTHRWLCGSGGCHYQLFQFDIDNKKFVPYPNKPDTGWSEGLSLNLSKDRSELANFGIFNEGCETYSTFMDIFNLVTQYRQMFSLQQEALSGLAFSPDLKKALISRIAGCSTENQQKWDETCGLSIGFDVHNMQFWDLAANQRTDLVPGTEPAWSPDGGWVAFRSCLQPNSTGGWDPSDKMKATIYIMDASGKNITAINDGDDPQWRPQS